MKKLAVIFLLQALAVFGEIKFSFLNHDKIIDDLYADPHETKLGMEPRIYKNDERLWFHTLISADLYIVDVKWCDPSGRSYLRSVFGMAGNSFSHIRQSGGSFPVEHIRYMAEGDIDFESDYLNARLPLRGKLGLNTKIVHVSAHLVDGHPDIAGERLPVSNEYIEALFCFSTPLYNQSAEDRLRIYFGGAWYFHAIALPMQYVIQTGMSWDFWPISAQINLYAAMNVETAFEPDVVFGRLNAQAGLRIKGKAANSRAAITFESGRGHGQYHFHDRYAFGFGWFFDLK